MNNDIDPAFAASVFNLISIKLPRDDLIRFIVSIQWRQAVCVMAASKPKPSYLAAVLSAQEKSAEDIVQQLLVSKGIV
jgi:hypothetical protein